MDYEKLKRDLIEYYGTAMYSGFPMAVVELSDIECATQSELILMAKQAGIDLGKYKDESYDEA